MKRFLILSLLVLLFGCGKKEAPRLPSDQVYVSVPCTIVSKTYAYNENCGKACTQRMYVYTYRCPVNASNIQP